jgi:hypothetical protein
MVEGGDDDLVAFSNEVSQRAGQAESQRRGVRSEDDLFG